jgi:hypothetical protein
VLVRVGNSVAASDGDSVGLTGSGSGGSITGVVFAIVRSSGALQAESKNSKVTRKRPIMTRVDCFFIV